VNVCYGSSRVSQGLAQICTAVQVSVALNVWTWDEPELTSHHRVVRLRSWYMTDLDATPGVAGEGAPVGVTGHETTSGAGGR
jgi:hypothetical protein